MIGVYELSCDCGTGETVCRFVRRPGAAKAAPKASSAVVARNQTRRVAIDPKGRGRDGVNGGVQNARRGVQEVDAECKRSTPNGGKGSGVGRGTTLCVIYHRDSVTSTPHAACRA